MTGQSKILSSGLVSMETLLGWKWSGKVPERVSSLNSSMMSTSLLVKEINVSEMWKLDFLRIQDTSEQKTKELYEVLVEHFFEDWQNNFFALKGLQVASRKLKAEKLYKEYGEVFKEGERDCIVEEIPEEEIASSCHYLPHRHVVKENNATKIRLVFNASSRQMGSPSLNDCDGNRLSFIELIPSIIARFCLHKFGITADIRNLYLQFSLHKKDRDFLRFLGHGEDEKLKNYRHHKVIFGISCSPFLLSSNIRYHLERKFDEARQGNRRYLEEIIRQGILSFYVDSCLTSIKTESALKQFIEVATEIIV
ncbi:integrase catalytic domain-containing protein [Trichonephila inaurata madagascariensis]|uniref:Integrase catalytic domain-containing protein n=1 Tax=Trichonephila inaurata madagascariensis TaxID=2747483 RepID=A0A8X7C4R5_9ARAC|nr:integrase catalytic domain-containing protein [Trichonephila inaurata madagascariensis]